MPPEERQHEIRDELLRRLRLQLYDFTYSLQHSTNGEAMTGAGRCLGAIHAMRHRGLLSDDEVREYQAQVRADFVEWLPQYTVHFDDLCLLAHKEPPHDPTPAE